MNTTFRASLLAAGLALASTSAHAQFSIDWYSLDNGGGRTVAGSFEVTATIGQPDAGDVTSTGSFEFRGGFWGAGLTPCYANCDSSTAAPILNTNDFQCFLNLYAAGDPAANCDGSTAPPILNTNDFQCFLNKFATGCP